MRKFLFPLLCLVAITATASDVLDGAWWQHLSDPQKGFWAAGWMYGMYSREALVVQYDGRKEFKRHSDAATFLEGVQSDQVVRGLDQFYAADYRNLTVPLQISALLVAEYARGVITKEQMLRVVESSRSH